MFGESSQLDFSPILKLSFVYLFGGPNNVNRWIVILSYLETDDETKAWKNMFSVIVPYKILNF